jgi:hypothetical protein
MGRRSLVVFEGRKVGLKKIQGINLLVVWDGVFAEGKWVYLPSPNTPSGDHQIVLHNLGSNNFFFPR